MDGNIDSIQIKGIVRNLTKNGVEDGHSEDLINLRFKDGSWRTSGDGKLVFTMGHKQNDIPYVSQSYHNMYIHTNVYRHVLGIIGDTGTTDEGFLTWFADIDADGVFTGKTTPIHICRIGIADKITVTQTGNLLTIIADSGAVTFALFNERDQKYNVTSIDENGAPNARTLYPYGNVHFNLDCSDDNARKVIRVEKDAKVVLYEENYISANSVGVLQPEVWHADMLEAYRTAQEKNIFTRPFLAIVAVKLYDGKYAFASAPTLLWVREALSSTKVNKTTAFSPISIFGYNDWSYNDEAKPFRQQPCVFYPDNIVNETAYVEGGTGVGNDSMKKYLPYPVNTIPVYSSGLAAAATDIQKELFGGGGKDTKRITELHGADILLSIDDVSIIKNYPDLFTGIAVFITPEVDIYETAAEPTDDEIGEMRFMSSMSCVNCSYIPKARNIKNIRQDLLNSPFFLLREYDTKELDALSGKLRIDLTDPKYDAILANITQQPRFEGEAIERKTIKPKIAYTYNGRLHLANYESSSFYGYPIDTFLYNNHSGLIRKNANDLGLKHFKESFPEQINTPIEVQKDMSGGKLIIPYTNFPTYQFQKNKYYFIDKSIPNYKQYLPYIPCWVAVNVYSSQLGSSVTRYIAATDTSGNQFVEDLPPILSFPDSRYDKMEIIIHRLMNVSAGGVNGPALCEYKHEFTLQAHPYLNLAYYMSDDLKPITACDSKSLWWIYDCEDIPWPNVLGQVTINNATENFPNGLKVSSTNNPLSFPYKNTYQVGSSEIVALCSNAIAVGTGQTGAAPLYVFCKDGIYALLVDASGQMTYTNARIIARDVCNNHRSVTPIDNGVVFTTDRGLMIISGEQVQELSESVEGEPLNYVDISATGSFTPKTAPLNIMALISNLSIDYCDGVNFLRYIHKAIINYNHNLRELIISDGYYVESTVRETDMATEMTNYSKIQHINTNDPKQIGYGTTLPHYSYVLDRYGNWKRYTFGANEFVSNYPTSYRIENGNWFKVDEEENGLTDEADNGFFICSRAIKLNSLDFKQALRFVVRGYFNTQDTTNFTTSLSEQTQIENQTLYVTPIERETGYSQQLTNNVAVPGPTETESKDSQEVHVADMLLSDVQTFTIDDGNECDITITFPQNKVFSLSPLVYFAQRHPAVLMLFDETWDYWSLAPATPSNPTALFDLSQQNKVILAYQLIDSRNDVIKEWIFPATITDSSISVELDLNVQTVHINNAGTYKLKLVIKALDIYMTTNSGKNMNVGSKPFETENQVPLELVINSETEINAINTPVQLSFNVDDYIRIPAFVTNPKLELNCKGYIDFVCDYEHSEPSDKICQFDEQIDNYAAFLLTMTDGSDNNILQDTKDSLELIDPYTLRLYLNGKNNINLPDTPEGLSNYNLQLYVKSLNTKLNCIKPQTINNQIIFHSLSNTQMEEDTIKKNPKLKLVSNNIISLLDSSPFTTSTYAITVLYTGSENPNTEVNLERYKTILQNVSTPVLHIYKVINGHIQTPSVFSLPANLRRTLYETPWSYNENERIYSKLLVVDFLWSESDDILHPTLKTIPLDDYLQQGDQFVVRIEKESSQGWAADLENADEGATASTEDDFTLSAHYSFTTSKCHYEYEQDQFKLQAVIPTNDKPAIDVTLRYDLLPLFDYGYTIDNDAIIENIIQRFAPVEILIVPGQPETSYVGAYVFGSYDGRKWALLGGKEKTGQFTDIGCLVERTDVRYIRYIIAGNVKGNSRIDGIEITTKPSTLNNKIR